MMAVFASALAVLVMVLTGLALFHRLAPRLLAGRGNEVSETDLIMLGVLPGLALVGMLATYLAVLHLLRVGVVIFLALAILYVCRREVYGILAHLGRQARGWLAQARQGNFFPLIAAGAFVIALAAGLLLCVIPSENVDVWVFHLPLARSFIAHHGFVFPQLSGMLFYSTQPDFQEILFSVAMMAVPSFIAASVVNVAVLFGFILILPTFAQRARDIQVLVAVAVFFWWQNFPLGAAEPMGDLSRSCFSVGAFLFAYRYAVNFRFFDLAISALLAGTAAASKYTELLTPALIFVTVAPLMIRRRHTWLHMVLAIAVFLAAASVWYIKNAVLLGNPVFPFFLGHPGLSNQWMADYMQEMTRPFNPADRIYSTNLLTARGWMDFVAVLHKYFRALRYPALLAGAGLLLPQRRRWMLPLWTIVLFVIWYAVMFNAIRWAVPAMLMLLSTAFITWTWIADRLAAAWNPQWPTMVVEATVRRLRRYPNPWISLISILLLVFLAFGVLRFKQGHGNSWLPSWMSHDLAVGLVSPWRMDRYLAETRPHYTLYRYIGQHDLKMVMQPFDNGGTFYASSYNGGRSNEWVLYFRALPPDVSQIDRFVAQNGIRYFVDLDPVQPIDAERMGAAHVVLAKAVIGHLKTHARLILRDGDMYLYEILAPGRRP